MVRADRVLWRCSRVMVQREIVAGSLVAVCMVAVCTVRVMSARIVIAPSMTWQASISAIRACCWACRAARSSRSFTVLASRSVVSARAEATYW